MNWRGRALRFCQLAGLPILEPIVRLAAGEEPREQLRGIAKFFLVPIAAVAIFLVLWNAAAKTIVTDSARLPSPGQTWQAGMQLLETHFKQRATDQAKILAKREEAKGFLKLSLELEHRAKFAGEIERESLLDQALKLRARARQAVEFVPASGRTFVDQVIRSLGTVFFGFFMATLVAVPVGILCGMNPWFNAAVSPFIQIFKPVSPLAWLPLAFIVVVWLYSTLTSAALFFEKSFLISAVTVCLCSLWPTLVNTTLGVASVDKDYLNVARVLRLSPWQTLFKIILPASLPYMFAGLRISLGVGWMVLIAADMLAQNPGLGKFVWDEFQNGSSQTYARIAFSVLVIGLIGLLLDRIMICLRNLVSFGNSAGI